jgi:adenylate cyclase
VNDYINAWADLAEHSLQTGLEIAQRAVQVDEEEPQAHFVVGVALLWSRKHDRALAELQRSVAIAPNFAEAHLAMAHVLIYSGDAAGAIDSLDTGMRLDPLYRDIALYFLAEARISLGQFDEAVAALKLRLQRDSNSASSYALLASSASRGRRPCNSRRRELARSVVHEKQASSRRPSTVWEASACHQLPAISSSPPRLHPAGFSVGR